jgi:hypothetical protein
MKSKIKRYKPENGSDRKALAEHVAQKAEQIHEKYLLASPAAIPADLLHQMLLDSDVARFPTEIRFSSDIEDGLFGYCRQKGEHPREGYDIILHSAFGSVPEHHAYLVFYLLVRVNYGLFATYLEAEKFAAGIFGLPVDVYYEKLCQLVDQFVPSITPASDGLGCSCGVG